MKKPLKLPKFKDEDEERDFWSDFDLSEYFEPSDFVDISYPNLKPTRLPSISEKELLADPDEVIDFVNGAGKELVIKRNSRDMVVMIPLKPLS